MTLPIKWTDWAGRTHDEHHRPPGCDARHARDFRALERLPHLPHAAHPADSARHHRRARRLPLQGAVPESRRRPANKPAGKHEQIKPNTPLPGMHLGFVHGPEDLLVDKAGRPSRLDKAYSWDAPDRRARPACTWRSPTRRLGDPYPIDVMFIYMANMAWNSSMNIAGDARVPDRQECRRHLQDRQDHLLRRLRLRDGLLCRPDPAGHDLSRTLTTASRCSTGRSRSPTVPPTPSAIPSSSPIATCGRSRMC